MKKSAMKMFVALIGISAMGACSHRPLDVPLAVEGPYRIGREDVLDVAIWHDSEVSRTVPVRPDGCISLPMAGEIVAEGRTPLELELEIKKKLLPFVQEPKVTVIVKEVNSKVYITGEVAHPGAFLLRGRLSLVQSIALAGGFSNFANPNDIVVIRQGDDGGKFPAHYSEMLKGDARQDLILRPGDTVVVQ